MSRKYAEVQVAILPLDVPTPAERLLAGHYTPKGHRAWSPSRARKFAMRTLILGRDAHTCQRCGYADPSGAWLELDHITPYKLGGYFIISNLQTLCIWCNTSKGASA